MPGLGIGDSAKQKLPLQFVSPLGSSCPEPDISCHQPLRLTDRNPSLFRDLAKSSNGLAPVDAGGFPALPWEHSEPKDKPLLMAHINDLYVLIRNA